jgi:hypothetical protein
LSPRVVLGVSSGRECPSAVRRVLLGEILGTLGRSSLREVRIVRVHGGVNLESPVEAEQPTWELAVAGIAFHDRFAEQHLPSVLAVSTRQVGWPTSNAAGTNPPRATPASVRATRATMRRLALASGARITELTVSAPDALAVALRLRVRDAAHFSRASSIEVDDAHGLAWADGETRLGGDSYVRPSLSGCNPFPPPRRPTVCHPAVSRATSGAAREDRRRSRHGSPPRAGRTPTTASRRPSLRGAR